MAEIQDEEEQKVKQLLTECKDHDFVRFSICDINGIPMVKAVPKRHLQKFIKEGVKLWEGCIFVGPNTTLYHTMMKDNGPDDVCVRPIAGTFHSLPWATRGEFKVGEFLCETHVMESGLPQEGGPRYIARTQLSRLQEMGLHMLTGWEMEFMLLDKETRSIPASRRESFGTESSHAAFEEFMYRADTQLLEAGINVENYLKETARGQLEFTLMPLRGIHSSDQVFMFKQAIREIALQNDLFATFMSKPFFGLGNGMHFNFSIWDDKGNNAFYDESQADNLSEFARYWIAGIMKHCTALCAVMNPTVNCYRRYHKAWAPDKINWLIACRSATLRVKNQGPSGCYMENRLPSGSANPYVVMAATIAAGLDGVINKIECPPLLSVEKASSRLPDTLQEALLALKEDEVLCEALGSQFIKYFTAEKEEIDLDRFKNWDPSDESDETFARERELYLEEM